MQNQLLEINGLVLAGGKSSRMGTDKAFITYHQKPQIFHLKEMLVGLGLNTFLSINASQKKEIHASEAILLDDFLEKGPLGGLTTAFSLAPNAAWLILGCDYPKIQNFDLQHLIYQSKQTSKSVAYFLDGYFLPTIAIYKPKDFQNFIGALKKDELKLQTILKNIKCMPLEPLNNDRFVSINTPQQAKEFKNIKNGT